MLHRGYEDGSSLPVVVEQAAVDAELQQANAAVTATLETLRREFEHLRASGRTLDDTAAASAAIPLAVFMKLDAVYSEQKRCSW